MYHTTQENFYHNITSGDVPVFIAAIARLHPKEKPKGGLFRDSIFLA